MFGEIFFSQIEINFPTCFACRWIIRNNWELYSEQFLSCGIEESKIKSMMQERFKKYEQAFNEYKDKQTVSDIELN